MASLCGGEHTPLVWTRIIAPMRRLPILVLVAAFLPALAWLAPANAQAGAPAAAWLTPATVTPATVQAAAPAAAPKRVQSERNAVDLKQGMTVGEVQKLLGKPQRTALRSNGLQWTYVWSGAGMSSSSERTLSVDFSAKAADQWLVNGWGWNGY
jgi:hypothetical protein